MALWRGKFAYCTHVVVISRRIFQTSSSKMTNNIIVDIVSYVVTSKLLATHFKFLFSFTKIGVRMRKKNTQESEGEWWARLDKRIEG